MICIYCNCTDLDACLDQLTGEACSWSLKLNIDEGVCSACIDEHLEGDRAALDNQKLILPGDPEFHL